ncbi:hypothetical protein R1flu_021962 [Riccia fluitans]|uniref:Uncharacterized protein n=1 Tax=Riccia fluitans TaxID=41844 RepID=A0ABD1ZQX6_9MARC
MATAMEELCRLTLFDREAELMPESRPAWQQSMELCKKFVRYPGPKPNDLHLIHFWFLEHYGILPFYLQMQSEGIPAKVFFSIVSICRYVSVADKTEHLELQGLTGQRLVVSPEVIQEAFGISREVAQDEEVGATWPNLVTLKFAEVEELGEYVRKFSEGTTDAVVIVSWAPTLMQIIKHNRALLFNSSLNCAEPWEVYEECSGSYEQSDVLRAVHSRKAVSKDTLPRLLRLKPEARVENMPPEAPTQPQPRKR